jgi:hypothetical protein
VVSALKTAGKWLLILLAWGIGIIIALDVAEEYGRGFWLILAAFGVAWYFEAKLNKIERTVDRIERHLAKIRAPGRD